MDKPLCTVLHISDLHFGSQFPIDGDRPWRKIISRVPCLHHVTGYFPHSYQYAHALAIAVRQILRRCRDEGVPAIVVHTGDLTASGAMAEFVVGDTFLRHGHYLENGALAGLGLETEFKQQVFDIPGNHDWWRRRSPKDHGAFASHYGGAYPRFREILTASKRILFYGLDSNRSTLFAHRLANGEVESSSLADVCERLEKSQTPDTLQIVCLHHPLRLRPRTVPRMFGVEILKLREREKVESALRAAGANLVLGGHIHQQEHQAWRFLAGSACQISSRPSFWWFDLFPDQARYTYLHIPKQKIHFEVAASRSGSEAY